MISQYFVCDFSKWFLNSQINVWYAIIWNLKGINFRGANFCDWEVKIIYFHVTNFCKGEFFSNFGELIFAISNVFSTFRKTNFTIKQTYDDSMCKNNKIIEQFKEMVDVLYLETRWFFCIRFPVKIAQLCEKNLRDWSNVTNFSKTNSRDSSIFTSISEHSFAIWVLNGEN